MFKFFKKRHTIVNEETHNDINILFDNQVNRNLKAKELEKLNKVDDAIVLYEQNIKERFEGNSPYDRLAIIYRKRKEFKEEVRVLSRAISVFEEINRHTKRQDVAPKLAKFKDRLIKARELEQNL